MPSPLTALRLKWSLLPKTHRNGVLKLSSPEPECAAHLPGVIAAMTPIPVIGVPINASLDGMDALLAIAQMPPGIPVATTAINGAMNAGILAAQILAVGDNALKAKIVDFKESLKKKIVDANNELAKVKYDYKTN